MNIALPGVRERFRTPSRSAGGKNGLPNFIHVSGSCDQLTDKIARAVGGLPTFKKAIVGSRQRKFRA